MGTRDVPPPTLNTRIESPGAKVRTPARRSAPPPLPRAAADRPEDRVGQVLGSYRLLELIGKGGMGFVYRAEHAKLGREVALKVLRSDYARRRDAVARFFQEARTVNRIRHRNIVDVTDFVELDDGTTYIIMELLRGRSLGAWAKVVGAIDLPRALALLIQICDGLAAAHSVGVIHRDLKPDNIIVVSTPDGAEQVKLLDFGVAKLLNRDDEDIGLETAAGSVIGTPAYMSPEQAGGLVVDNRADIYSLGAIMYELFCGQPLFRGRSFGEYVRKHLNEQPVPPRETVSGGNLDPRLESVLMRCLSKDPGRRHQSAEDLRDDLLHLLAGFETHEHALDGGPRLRPHVSSGVRTPHGHHSGIGNTTLPPPGPATLAAMGFHSQPGYSSQHPSLVGSQVQPPSRAWLYGLAAVAVAGGAIGAVVVVASRDDHPLPAHTAPAAPPATATAITPMGPDRTPAPVIEVRVDASPGAQVMAAGASVVVCAAPCTISIDPADGGSTTQRDFVVRKPGFRDQTFTIDLGHPPTAVPIQLEPLAAGGGHRERPAAPPTVAVEPPPTPPTPPPTVAVEPPPTPPTPPTPPVVKKSKKDGVDPAATIDPFAP